MLKDVASEFLEAEKSAYVKQDYSYLVRASDAAQMIKNIMPLYDHLLQQKPHTPLFDCYARSPAAGNSVTEPLQDPNNSFSERLAHASGSFALVDAQRSALAHLLATRNGEILALNGPPGTGKTTLVLSVVATLWARAALEESMPPVIVATSANNQAVTNIIDAFEKDFGKGEPPFFDRWLPLVKSYGSYFPSSFKLNEASKKYLTSTRFNEIETEENLYDAQKAYLIAATAAFPNDAIATPKDAVASLHREICREASTLKEIETAWQNLVVACWDVDFLVDSCPHTDISSFKAEMDKASSRTQQATNLLEELATYRTQESLLQGALAWLPEIRKKRVAEIRRRLQPFLPEDFDFPDTMTLSTLEDALKNHHKRQQQSLAVAADRYERFSCALKARSETLQKWNDTIQSLKTSDGDCFIDKNELSPEQIQKAFALADRSADTDIRFKIFRLTTHYWEGRWLMAMEKLCSSLTLAEEKKKTGEKFLQARWWRRMMITPCAVSTLHRLPTEMKIQRKEYANDYLFNFIDLLIVDEAGQALPEIAGASFSLAKQALVIGDTQQISPISSVSSFVDIGNLKKHGLLPLDLDIDDALEYLGKMERASSQGSVMKIAQAASHWHAIPEMERGLFLLEHRRCYDEIISYCNNLCYQGKLEPRRGKKVEKEDISSKTTENKGQSSTSADDIVNALPAMGYLHIDGLCKKGLSGSSYNKLEADVIVQWIVSHKAALEKKYEDKGKIVDIVAIVTPFSAQKIALTEACRKAGILESNGKSMTIGTVHALQGAERQIVIFSPVYTKLEDGLFIDSSPSMLNVAVSRAKDAFLVMGDMDTFESAAPHSPRKQLGQVLFEKDTNEINFTYSFSKDVLAAEKDISALNNFQEHDDFLKDVLIKAKKDVIIISPWINYQRIEDADLFEALKIAVSNKVTVTVFCDRAKNYKTSSVRYHATLEKLHSIGIQTKEISRLHSKIVAADNSIFCSGSFNWFSAWRDPKKGDYECSLIQREKDISHYLTPMLSNIEKRALPVNQK